MVMAEYEGVATVVSTSFFPCRGCPRRPLDKDVLEAVHNSQHWQHGEIFYQYYRSVRAKCGCLYGMLSSSETIRTTSSLASPETPTPSTSACYEFLPHILRAFSSASRCSSRFNKWFSRNLILSHLYSSRNGSCQLCYLVRSFLLSQRKDLFQTTTCFLFLPFSRMNSTRQTTPFFPLSSQIYPPWDGFSQRPYFTLAENNYS